MKPRRPCSRSPPSTRADIAKVGETDEGWSVQGDLLFSLARFFLVGDTIKGDCREEPGALGCSGLATPGSTQP